MDLEMWQKMTKKHFKGGHTLKILFESYKKEKQPTKLI